MDSVDALIMGRRTFEKVLSLGSWPYGSKPVIVLSHQSISLPSSIPDSVTHSSESPRALLRRLSEEGMSHVYIDGGATIQGFLSEGLIDEITVTVIPVILGGGIPLFGSLENDIKLTHVSTRAYEFGFVQSTYYLARNA